MLLSTLRYPFKCAMMTISCIFSIVKYRNHVLSLCTMKPAPRQPSEKFTNFTRHLAIKAKAVSSLLDRTKHSLLSNMKASLPSVAEWYWAPDLKSEVVGFSLVCPLIWSCFSVDPS